MIDNSKKRSQDDYLFFKEHKICVSCHKEKAMINALRCPECADKLAIRDKKRYEKLITGTEYRPKISAYRKQLRQRRRDAGICHVCGIRPILKGYARCSECLIANRRKKDKRYNNDILRSERPSYEMCYICGKPVKDNYKVCQKHYTNMVKAAEKSKENPSPGMIEHKEHWKNLNNLIFRNGVAKIER